jgi:hypothetical protein
MGCVLFLAQGLWPMLSEDLRHEIQEIIQQEIMLDAITGAMGPSQIAHIGCSALFRDRHNVI